MTIGGLLVGPEMRRSDVAELKRDKVMRDNAQRACWLIGVRPKRSVSAK